MAARQDARDDAPGFGQFEVLTFDCYGTLVDWESGLLAALRRALSGAGGIGEDELLEAYGRHEAAAEQPPYRTYRQVLGESLRELAAELALPVTPAAVDEFSESVGLWPAFADTAAAMQRLHERFRLGVITNCDDDLFAVSSRLLGVELDWTVTAEQAQAYKPSLRPFELAFETIGVPRDRILHVAQSLYHDHVPAATLGLSSVWIDRRHGRPGSGATPLASAVPDWTFPSMEAFAASAVPVR